MTGAPDWTWRDMLERFRNTFRPSQFEQEIGDIPPETAEEELPGIAGVTTTLITTAALAATFDLAPPDARTALKEIGDALVHPPEPDGLEALTPDQRKVYDLYIPFLRYMYRGIGPAVVGVFTHYLDGDYDLADDPDALTAQARDLAVIDPEAALALLDSVGAMGLRGLELWWRWPDELKPPLAERALAIRTLLEDTYALGALEAERENWRSRFRSPEPHAEAALPGEEQAASGAPDEEDPLDPLLDRLYDGAEALTDDLRAAFVGQREAAIPALIDHLEDRDLWATDSDGQGYVPVHAATLLGSLMAAEAVESLIEAAVESDPEDLLRDEALWALGEIGAPTVPGLLRFLRYSGDLELKAMLAGPLAVAGKGMEAAYAALTTLYVGTTWDDGYLKDIAEALGAFGDPRAVPLLRAALGEPEVTGWNRYTVLVALRKLGEETAEEPEEVELPEDEKPTAIGALTSPETFREFNAGLAPDRQNDAESIAHTFTGFVERALVYSMVEAVARSGIEVASAFAAILHGEVERTPLDADTADWPEWEQEAYEHLATCAWPDLSERMLALQTAFSTLALDEYDAEADPNELIAAAQQVLDEDAGKALDLLGQAGALALTGRTLWQHWPAEAKPPLDTWTAALLDTAAFLQDLQRWPLEINRQPAADAGPGPFPTLNDALDRRPRPTPEDKAFMADLLNLASSNLPESMIARAKSLSPAIGHELINLIDDEGLWELAAKPGRGWPPMNAVTLLGHLRSPQAAPLLIDLALEFDEGDEPYHRAIEALGLLGPPAAEALLLEMQYGSDRAAHVALAPALAEAGRADARTAPALLALFERVAWREGRGKVAEALGRLGDERAAAPLRAALDDRRARADDVEAAVDALAALGVPVDTDTAVQAARRRAGLGTRTPIPRSEWGKVSRTAPCPCGSGKKYKYCHGSGALTVH